MAKRELTPEAEALAILADRRGREPIAADLRLLIDGAETRAQKWAEAFHEGRQPFDGILLGIADAAEDDRDARRRLATLGDDATDGPTLGERHLGAILATDAGATRFRESLARATADIKEALADVENRIKEISPDTANIETLAGLVAERRRVRSILAGLEKDAVLLSEAQGKAVGEAIEAAGGVDAVARGVRDAELVRGEYFEGNSRFDALVAAATEADTLKQQLGKFGASLDPSDYEAGSLASMLASKLIKVQNDADTIRATIDREEREAIRAMIDDACRGDEASRAVLADVARETAMAFSPGFADALDATVSPQTEADALIAALRDKAARDAAERQRSIDQAMLRKNRRNADAAARARQEAHEASLNPSPSVSPALFSAESQRLIAEMLGGD